jgi:hypothetical protein
LFFESQFPEKGDKDQTKRDQPSPLAQGQYASKQTG